MQSSLPISKKGGLSQTGANISNLLYSLPAVPGVDPRKNQAEGNEGGKEEPDLGKNFHLDKNLILPPLKGFRQLADADPIQEMYKELITTKVPVLFQTMMMVENGAATGYIGSLNTLANLMNNTVQSQQFQLQLMEATDTTGQMKYAYIGAIHKALAEKGGAKSWPAAIYVANGDAAKGGSKEFGEAKLDGNSKAYSFNTLPSYEQQNNNAGQEKLDAKLSEILFAPEGNNTGGGNPGGQGNQRHNNQDLDKLKEEYLELLGDVEFKIEGGEKTDQVARVNRLSFVKPVKPDDKGRVGLQKKVFSESDKAWKALNRMMKSICDFKQSDRNSGKAPGEKEIPSNISGFYQEEDLKKASAPDIVVTQLLVDELWAVFQPRKPIKDITCDDEFPEADFPDATNFKEPDQSEPDKCSGGGEQRGEVYPCLRNRILVHIASIVGRSRAYHTYLNMAMFSDRFAKDASTAHLNRKLFEEILGRDQDINMLIDRNHDTWVTFATELARFLASSSSSGGKLGTQQPQNVPSQNSGGFGDKR